VQKKIYEVRYKREKKNSVRVLYYNSVFSPQVLLFCVRQERTNPSKIEQRVRDSAGYDGKSANHQESFKIDTKKGRIDSPQFDLIIDNGYARSLCLSLW
jgi:hypothetical protein